MSFLENNSQNSSGSIGFSCGICASKSHSDELHPVEGMLGLGERFDYKRCADCGCLQLTNPPADISKYYPRNYYAFESDARLFVDRFPMRRKFLYYLITAARLGWPTSIGRILQKLGSGPFITNSMRMLVRPLKRKAAILDVGCANGRELSAYWGCGFTNLIGIDPYLAADIHHPCGVSIWKKELREAEGKFDLIMFHHVLEHVADQRGMLELAKERLNAGGQILVRIPLSDSETALAYREKWVQLDAPRHFYLHTRNSLERLAEKAGLQVARVVYDSEAFQFIGSELYRRGGISLNEFYADYALNYTKFFNQGDDRSYQKRAEELNLREAGDQAGFCLVAK